MMKTMLMAVAVVCLSGCVVPDNRVVYPQEPVVAGSPVLVYPPEPLVGESIIIEGRPYYRHYYNGHAYYHHLRHP